MPSTLRASRRHSARGPLCPGPAEKPPESRRSWAGPRVAIGVRSRPRSRPAPHHHSRRPRASTVARLCTPQPTAGTTTRRCHRRLLRLWRFVQRTRECCSRQGVRRHGAQCGPGQLGVEGHAVCQVKLLKRFQTHQSCSVEVHALLGRSRCWRWLGAPTVLGCPERHPWQHRPRRDVLARRGDRRASCARHSAHFQITQSSRRPASWWARARGIAHPGSHRVSV